MVRNESDVARLATCQLGVKALPLSSAGRNFEDRYSAHLRANNIETKYFVRALEMTTNEIAENRDLFPLNDEQFETWIRILHSSDMVKYARETSNTDQIISDLTDVRSIISDV